jgi:AcrR family transcriptional regulator
MSRSTATAAAADVPAKFRAPGIERRKRLLAAARQLLGKHELDEISLADVARAARIPKGSAYHYYGDIMQLYVQLMAELGDEMLEDARRPIRIGAHADWTQVVSALVRRGAQYFSRDRAARQLIISMKTPPELKMRDRQSDRRIAQLFEAHIERQFELPQRPERTAIFFRAIEIADLMFTLSMLQHGSITAEMTEEAIRAVTGYLRAHFPATLRRRGQH